MYGSRGEPGEAKALKRNFNAGYGAYRSAGNFFKASAKHWSLQAATSQRLIAFAPEGLPLDRCITLDYEIPFNFFERAPGATD